MPPAPSFSILRIALFERPVRLRMPFRFGAATVTAAPQAFVRVRIALADGREADGASAELMVPKWFDKNPALDQDATVAQLRVSLDVAREAYLDDARPLCAFAHSADRYAAVLGAGAQRGLPPLAAAFGAAEIDKAVLDALCRALGVSCFEALRRNAVGLAPHAVVPDLAGFDFDELLAGVMPGAYVEARHTVGLADTIAGRPDNVRDGLPESLQQAIEAYGLRWFKLKVGGDVSSDLARLEEIAAVLDTLDDYRVTLDGNEQYEDLHALGALLDGLDRSPRLARLREALAYIEQPIPRASALEREVRDFAARVPLMIDESDGTLDAFPRARALGYAGVSSKSCKGLYKSIVNLARCRAWNAALGHARHFVSAEDLTAQAGLAVQQDLALALALGLKHAERNGHHYVRGMAGAPRGEQDAFAFAHPDLYEQRDGIACLRIVEGRIATDSLGCAGFATTVHPDWSALAPMQAPATLDSARRTA